MQKRIKFQKTLIAILAMVSAILIVSLLVGKNETAQVLIVNSDDIDLNLTTMNNRLFAVAAMMLTLAFAGCRNEARQAALCYETAVQAFESGNYVLARQNIDSIRILYPKVIDVQNIEVEKAKLYKQ